ncbi:hypothetical protein AKO1_011497 [Acrasis kona]|uniref:Uncharacterized protein n=1 Tax=Acrasis kona TaxID=1008807 RepID=A0AAW2Z2F7_9EUKA
MSITRTTFLIVVLLLGLYQCVVVNLAQVSQIAFSVDRKKGSKILKAKVFCKSKNDCLEPSKDYILMKLIAMDQNPNHVQLISVDAVPDTASPRYRLKTLYGLLYRPMKQMLWMNDLKHNREVLGSDFKVFENSILAIDSLKRIEVPKRTSEDQE